MLSNGFLLVTRAVDQPVARVLDAFDSVEICFRFLVSVCLSVCLSVPSIYLSIHSSIDLSVCSNRSINQINQINASSPQPTDKPTAFPHRYRHHRSSVGNNPFPSIPLYSIEEVQKDKPSSPLSIKPLSHPRYPRGSIPTCHLPLRRRRRLLPLQPKTSPPNSLRRRTSGWKSPSGRR